MRVARWQLLMAFLAVAGPMLLSPVIPVRASAGDDLAPLNLVHDVLLDSTNSFHCQLMSPDQCPLPGRRVALVCQGEEAASGLTNAHGVVVFPGLRAGDYLLQTEFGCSQLRLWNTKTAASHALQRLVVQSQADIVRGQCQDSLFSPQPVMLAALIAAAIAVPLAVHDSGDFPPGS